MRHSSLFSSDEEAKEGFKRGKEGKTVRSGDDGKKGERRMVEVM